MNTRIGLATLMLFALFGASVSPAATQPNSAREVWAVSQGTDSVYVLSFPEGQILDRVALPAGTQPHIVTFQSADYAYVGGMGNGTLSVIDANQRQVVKTLQFAPGGAHQARLSPDSSTLLVTVVPTKTLFKVAVDEPNQIWEPAGSLSFASLNKTPICSVFRSDSQRAYVSLLPDGLAIVDIPTMTVMGELPTDGFVACGMIKSPERDEVVLAASGGGGHVYSLDMTSDTLLDRGTLGSHDWHSFTMTPDGVRGFGTSPGSDEVVVIDLTTQPVGLIETLQLQAVPGFRANQPDAFGGGEPIVDGTLPVSLRAAGQVAFVDADSLEIRSYVSIAAPSDLNPANCNGCAVHGVTVRPYLEVAAAAP